MKKSEVLRQISTVLLLPVYVLIGIFISEAISHFTGVMAYYNYAIVLPELGLFATWKVAPFYKIRNIIFVYILGVFLAYALSFPIYYPEGHELAYTKTYKPFTLTIIWATLITCGLLIYELRNSKP